MSRLDHTGRLTEEPAIRVGFVGCGSHAFRNVYPTFQFAPVELVATCDLDETKAKLFARQFGAESSYTDYRQMLEREKLDAVFIVTNYDEQGRPRYGGIAADCLKAGKHVWMEKPPAARSADIEHLKSLAGDRLVMTGFKKMFFPANEKAKELMGLPDFGKTQLATIQYPMPIPEADDFARYLEKKERVPSMISFLDHLCHPVSLLLFLMGMPQRLFFERAGNGAGVATFSYADGRVATITLAHSSPHNAGMERTTIVSDRSHSILVENNIRVRYHRDAPGRGYGSNPNYYVGAPEETSAVWEPEFSLGQLYNKGLFLLGYYGEVNEFARAILDRRPLSKCHLDHAWQATRIFEAFAGGPGKVIELG